MTLDQNLADKAPGDPVRSADWNDLAAAVLRHETGKLDLSGGTVTGPLTAQGGLTAPGLKSQALGVELLKPDNGQVGFDNIVSTVTMISKQIQFQSDATLLLIGHGHGTTSDLNHALTMRVLVDGNFPGKDSGGKEWGVGYLAVPGGTWVPVTAMGTAQVTKGSHTLQLTVTGSTGGLVALHAPTLWVVRLGGFDVG
ncbi:hypothetical protein [Streptomyces hyaluromycini]|uniref:hypothetical protein n=1 Tax=Streptomyces hyaluromycini TaxID=1377993 RepID=UPI000B5C40DA|nr:hypothetical protein [Streptomyces hyaluromycini]